MGSRIGKWVVRIKTDSSLELIKLNTGDSLKQLQKACDGIIDVVRLSHSLDMYVNDEGMIIGLPPNFAATVVADMLSGRGMTQFLYGNALLAAHNGMGETVPLPDELVVKIYGVFRQSLPAEFGQ